MTQHFFYVEGTGVDLSLGKGKGGQTQNPYQRLQSYGTASHKDNKARFLVLIECDIEESKILPIESDWIARFDPIEEMEEEENLNRASTVEGFLFQSLEQVLQNFQKTLVALSVDTPVKIYKTDEEINHILRQFKQLQDFGQSSKQTLFEKFCKVFLGEKVPRRIQRELWQKFSAISNQSTSVFYKGITQWPTGVGKTIAILMKIVLAKDYCDKKGKVYRGLFVSPKNDIMNTILHHFMKLSEFGIKVYDGSNGKLSKLTVPLNEPCLVVACHAALLNEKGMRALPPMKHIHYDEVHRITGELYFQLLKEMMKSWGTNFLTGTSATPKTSSPDQHRKLAELFGDPLPILSKCDVDEAVKEGWIAKPRFVIRILPKLEERAAVLESFLDCCVELVLLKGKGGKSIFYIESSIDEVEYVLTKAREKYPHLNFYGAIDSERSDDRFLRVPVNQEPHILFACQRYREGSDIPGLEMTGKLIRGVTAAHNLIQISGRGLRIDYQEKEGWCLLARPCEPGATVDDVLDSIVLEIMDYLGKVDVEVGNKDVAKLVRTYFGEMSVEGGKCSLEETIQRVQAAYARNLFAKRTPREKYSLIQSYNKELGLLSRNAYQASQKDHPRFVENPKDYFKDIWISWYHFLGINTEVFPQTKAEFHNACREKGITSWELYKQKRGVDLPENPGELYSDWTNPEKEFGIEEEIVW